MRLIDADELLKDPYFLDESIPERNMFIDAVEGSPTINLEKHAKWLINPDGYYPYCSNCREETYVRKMTKYCPECGARMDRENI